MLTADGAHYSASEQIPTTPLIATGSFGPGLPASRVAAAIARGFRAGGMPADRCPITPEEVRGGDLGALLDALDFDTRMRRARAVVLGEWRLQERALAGSATFEIATRARQAGVPAYAVTGENRLDPFDARILDLQAILEAKSTRALAAAGRRLAQLV
jgi:glycerate kinase